MQRERVEKIRNEKRQKFISQLLFFCSFFLLVPDGNRLHRVPPFPYTNQLEMLCVERELLPKKVFSLFNFGFIVVIDRFRIVCMPVIYLR